jgi:archaellum biogenesis ATPase FlaH
MDRMKKFKEFLEESKNESLLNIFDIDDTLFRSKTSVVIMKDGKKVRELKTGEFNTYKLKPGEEYNFDQFRSGAHFRANAQPIDRMLERAKQAVKQGKTIIITARSDFYDKEPFLQKFRDHNFPIDNVHIERAGNLQKLKSDAKVSVTKAVVIRKYINSGQFKKIRMWDDHEGNLDTLLKLGKLHPEVEIEAYLVNPNTGESTRYTK